MFKRSFPFFVSNYSIRCYFFVVFNLMDLNMRFSLGNWFQLNDSPLAFVDFYAIAILSGIDMCDPLVMASFGWMCGHN